MTHIGCTLTTFILVTALVGVIAAKMTGKDNDKTTKGYFLAGSGLGGAFIAGSSLTEPTCPVWRGKPPRSSRPS